MAGVGRPTKYTESLADNLIAALASGDTTRAACKKVDITTTTLFRWLTDGDKESFRERYAEARRIQGEVHANRIIEASIELLEGEFDKEDGVTVQAKKVALDNLKWAAARMHPTGWGDRQTLEHTGKGGGALVVKFETEGA